MNQGNDKDGRGTEGAAPEEGARRPRRRGFLLGAGAAASAGAAVLVAGRSGPEPTDAALAPQEPKGAANRGYHVTEHVRKYYDSAKV